MNRTRPIVIVLHDRGDQLQASPGIDARVRSLVAWASAEGADVRVTSVAPDRSRRRSRALSALRPIGRLVGDLPGSGIVIVVALNAPHLTLLALRLSRRRRVIVDVCDSTLDTARGALRARLPLQAVKSALQVLAVAGIATRTAPRLSFVSSRDAFHDRAIARRSRPVLIPQTVDEALGQLDEYSGPPARVVVAADYSAYHNRAGMQLLIDCIEDKSLSVTVPIELFGPDAPDFALPAAMSYRGWMPSKADIYSGQTAVFVPNMSEAGQQNKLLEALRAGRPVLAGRAVARDLADGTTVATYADAEELRREFAMLQMRTLPQGTRWPTPPRDQTSLKQVLREFDGDT